MADTWVDWADDLYLSWMSGKRKRRMTAPDGPISRWHAEEHALCYAESAARLFGYRIDGAPPAPLEEAAAGLTGWTTAHRAAAVPARYWLRHGDTRKLRKFLHQTRPEGDVWWGWNDTDSLAHSAHHLWLYRILGIKLCRPVVELTLDLQSSGGHWRGDILPVWIDLDAISILRTAVMQETPAARGAKAAIKRYRPAPSPSSPHEQVALECVALEAHGKASPLCIVPWI